MSVAKLNCAGQQCPERDGCRRFEVRIPDGTIKIRGKDFATFAWASFDIERQHFGNCASLVPYRPRSA